MSAQGPGALKYASVNVDQAQLQSLGGEGWELVDISSRWKQLFRTLEALSMLLVYNQT
jgi:hypothetical protein